MAQRLLADLRSDLQSMVRSMAQSMAQSMLDEIDNRFNEVERELEQQQHQHNPARSTTPRRVAPAETDAQSRARNLPSDAKPPFPVLCSDGDGMRQLLEKCTPIADRIRFFAILSRGPFRTTHRGNGRYVHSIVERGF